jgi:hypothetical protein
MALAISKLINSFSVWYLTVSDVSFEAALYISCLPFGQASEYLPLKAIQ